jgi:hypothetical protein
MPILLKKIVESAASEAGGTEKQTNIWAIVLNNFSNTVLRIFIYTSTQ